MKGLWGRGAFNAGPMSVRAGGNRIRIEKESTSCRRPAHPSRLVGAVPSFRGRRVFGYNAVADASGVSRPSDAQLTSWAGR